MCAARRDPSEAPEAAILRFLQPRSSVISTSDDYTDIEDFEDFEEDESHDDGDKLIYISRVRKEEYNFSDVEVTLINAIQKGDKETILYFGREGADVNRPLSHGPTLLQLAIESNLPECVEALLEVGANPDVPGVREYRLPNKISTAPRSYTPLDVAVMFNRTDMIEMLYKHGANVRYVNKDGETAYTLAKKYDRVESIKVLEKLPGAQTQHNWGQYRLLNALQFYDHKEVLRILEDGVDPNFIGCDGASPVFVAIEEGKYNCLEVLLQKGADPNMMCLRTYPDPIICHSHLPWKWTPVECAIIYNRPTCIKLLFKFGADITYTDEYGKNALNLAYTYGRQWCVDVLKELGAEAQVVSEDDITLVTEDTEDQLSGGEEKKIEEDIIQNEKDENVEEPPALTPNTTESVSIQPSKTDEPVPGDAQDLPKIDEVTESNVQERTTDEVTKSNVQERTTYTPYRHPNFSGRRFVKDWRSRTEEERRPRRGNVIPERNEEGYEAFYSKQKMASQSANRNESSRRQEGSWRAYTSGPYRNESSLRQEGSWRVNNSGPYRFPNSSQKSIQRDLSVGEEKRRSEERTAEILKVQPAKDKGDIAVKEPIGVNDTRKTSTTESKVNLEKERDTKMESNVLPKYDNRKITTSVPVISVPEKSPQEWDAYWWSGGKEDNAQNKKKKDEDIRMKTVYTRDEEIRDGRRREINIDNSSIKRSESKSSEARVDDRKGSEKVSRSLSTSKNKFEKGQKHTQTGDVYKSTPETKEDYQYVHDSTDKLGMWYRAYEAKKRNEEKLYKKKSPSGVEESKTDGTVPDKSGESRDQTADWWHG